MDKSIIKEKLKQFQTVAADYKYKLNGLIADMQEKYGSEHSVIGIDVGTSSVKVVQMAKVNGQMVLIKKVLVDIKGDLSSEENVLAGINAALHGLDVKDAKVVSIINCPQTCTRKIVTPNMPKKELAEAIRWEAKNAIPFSIDEALIDYEILGEVLENGNKKLIVAVSAAPKKTVNRLINLLTKAGLDLKAFIPISLSAQNLIERSKPGRELNIAVVEMGAEVTELNIYQKGKLAFSRKLPIAGNDITKSLTSTLMTDQGKLELNISEAEKIKKEHGMPSSEDVKVIDGKILPSHILSLVRPCVEQLAGEIERSFDFYSNESHGEQVDKIILFGGGANLKGLVEALRAELDVNVVIGNAFEDIKTASEVNSGQKNEGPRFNLAVGAAFNIKDKINLLPIELKEKTKRLVENISLQAVVVGIVMTILLSYIGLNIQLGAQHKKMKALKLEKSTLVPQLEAMKSIIMAEQILSSHPHWGDVLREISNTIEPRMYLTAVTMEDGEIHLSGIIIKSDQGAQAILSNFMIALEEGMFRHVSLVTTKKESQDSKMSEFEITAEVD